MNLTEAEKAGAFYLTNGGDDDGPAVEPGAAPAPAEEAAPGPAEEPAPSPDSDPDVVLAPSPAPAEDASAAGADTAPVPMRRRLLGV